MTTEQLKKMETDARTIMPKQMSSKEIRSAFINYFKSLEHKIVSSSSLIPNNDPTLLFTNSGMVQFKDYFLGVAIPSYNKAASIQRCVRAGGKHNDLENVGYTKRHHTFFEMLGNFSFGDYFKREAIKFAWKFLTEVLEIPKERLWVTVFREDKESEEIWLKEMKVDPSRLTHCGEDDNFWSMGETGPCGPCTEIFYDHGPSVPGGPPGTPESHLDRYVEVWNLVFMQYNRDIEGKLHPLPKPCVDTGMGLERIACVMQGVHDDYDIDTFTYLLKALSNILTDSDKGAATSKRVIVDHIRTTAFLMADGVTPSNEGRGYVLRRIIRRAIRHGVKLGQKEPFFFRLIPAVIDIMGDYYPELHKAQHLIQQLIEQEEIQFSSTLEKGLKIIDEEISKLTGKQIPGQLVFQLYDTYGFPPDLTADIARERGLTLDYAGFEQAMARQRELSQQAQHFHVDQTHLVHIGGKTDFTGYEKMNEEGKITSLLHEEKPVKSLKSGEKGIIVLDRTPFYAESGGQVGDTGYIHSSSGNFRVKDTQKKGKVHLHIGEVTQGIIHINDTIQATVDESRKDIVLNHSATHLLHEALRRILGEHVVQKGSLVEAKRLRFDFSHPKALTKEQLLAVERLVNQQIRDNLQSELDVMSLEDAKKHGAMALFGEKYEEQVRVIKMGDFSTEVCGGTHAARTGDIGLFKIISETACAAGIRRIEALTGKEALRWVETLETEMEQISNLLKTTREQTQIKLTQILEQSREASREISTMRQKLAHQRGGKLTDDIVEISGVKILATILDNADAETLRSTVDQLKQELKTAAIILASTEDDKIKLVAGVTKDCLEYFNAIELLNQVAHQVGGKGGGRSDLAQGGGTDPKLLSKAMETVIPWIKERIKN